LEPGRAVSIENLGIREPATKTQEPIFDLGAQGVTFHVVLGQDLTKEYANF
jgi:hypothetical protein